MIQHQCQYQYQLPYDTNYNTNYHTNINTIPISCHQYQSQYQYNIDDMILHSLTQSVGRDQRCRFKPCCRNVIIHLFGFYDPVLRSKRVSQILNQITLWFIRRMLRVSDPGFGRVVFFLIFLYTKILFQRRVLKHCCHWLSFCNFKFLNTDMVIVIPY